MKNLKTLAILVLSALSLGVAQLSAAQAVPSFINYQGRLTNATGTPIADGNVALSIRLFATATGGSPFWDSGPITIPVRGGVFSVLLGSGTQMPPLNPSVFSWNGLLRSAWLEIVPQDAAPLTPRQPIATVPFAYLAETVSDNAITTVKLADGAVTTSKLLDGSVTTPKLASASVTQSKIAANSIDSTRLLYDPASFAKLTNNYVTYDPVLPRLVLSGSRGNLELRGTIEAQVNWGRTIGTWTQGVRTDVGGNNDDLKLLRYAGGNYLGIAMQVQNSTGNIGVNSSDPKERLHVEGNLLVSNGGNTANAGGAVNFSAYPTTQNSRTVFAYIKGALNQGDEFGQIGNLEFWTRPTTSSDAFVRRMMIRLDGAVAIGGDPNGATFGVYGTANKRDGSNLWDAWSDQRLKKDISDIENPLSRLLRLKGRTFV